MEVILNNATKYKIKPIDYISILSNCSFYFPYLSNTNRVRATLFGIDVLLFNLSEQDEGVDVFIAIPDDFNAIHYHQFKESDDGLTKNAHLTYHGCHKKRKMSGEIHLKNNGKNRFSGEPGKVEAPISKSDNLIKYPLPICRIELNHQAKSVKTRHKVENYFELSSPNDVFFNTIEVYLARKDFLRSLVACDKSVRNVLGSLFVFSTMEMFYKDTLVRGTGIYPQALALQTKSYELLVFARHEYVNPVYTQNTIRYFHTNNYFKNLISRKCIEANDSWFVAKNSISTNKNSMKTIKDFINEKNE